MNCESKEKNTLEYWYELLGLSLIQDIIFLCLIPIGIIGILLNILTLFVLRSDKFKLTFYTYLRAYTINSIFICFLNATRFSSNIRQNIFFVNLKLSLQFFCYIYIPILSGINVFESALDIILSIERLALLSKRIQWFTKIKPKKLCIILAFIFIVLAIPYWFFFKSNDIVTNIVTLNETKTVIIHFYIPRYKNGFIGFYMNVFPYFVDIIPIIAETCLNVLTVISIKKYTKNKTKLYTKSTTRSEKLAMNNISSDSEANSCGKSSPAKSLTLSKSKIMEVKMTILVILLSIMSIL
jgi:hypothetical protein